MIAAGSSANVGLAGHTLRAWSRVGIWMAISVLVLFARQAFSETENELNHDAARGVCDRWGMEMEYIPYLGDGLSSDVWNAIKNSVDPSAADFLFGEKSRRRSGREPTCIDRVDLNADGLDEIAVFFWDEYRTHHGARFIIFASGSSEILLSTLAWSYRVESRAASGWLSISTFSEAGQGRFVSTLYCFQDGAYRPKSGSD